MTHKDWYILCRLIWFRDTAYVLIAVRRESPGHSTYCSRLRLAIADAVLYHVIPISRSLPMNILFARPFSVRLSGVLNKTSGTVRHSNAYIVFGNNANRLLRARTPGPLFSVQRELFISCLVGGGNWIIRAYWFAKQLPRGFILSFSFYLFIFVFPHLLSYTRDVIIAGPSARRRKRMRRNERPQIIVNRTCTQ